MVFTKCFVCSFKDTLEDTCSFKDTLEDISEDISKDIGKVMTGPPSHGDYVFCFDKDVQIVLSGGLCKTIKQGYGKFVWGYTNNNDISVLYDKLLLFHDAVKCGSFYKKYYIVGVIDGCMVSINNIGMTERLKQVMVSSWTIFDENNNIQTSSTYILEPSFICLFIITVKGLVGIKNEFYK